MAVFKILLYFVFQSSLKMSKQNYLKDISEIKDLMNKSSKFISLSGLSGILAGVYALIGSIYFYCFIQKSNNNLTSLTNKEIISFFIVILITGIATTFTTIYFTKIRSKITKEKTWSITAKNLIKSYITILFIGLLYIIILYAKEEYNYIIAILLLFYGIGLMNASIHTKNIVKPLGIIQVIFGLICVFKPNYSFWLWTIGFGLVHLIYGSVIYFKYDKKNDV